jgi:(p)ppGpp synthase/HD superfamily hydrolase
MAHPVSAIETALEEISRAHVSFDEERIRRALTLAQQLYAGRSHWTGIPLLEHVLQVLKILIPFEPDEDAVIACLLHHVLDTREISLLELEDQFGPKVRALISGVHLLAHVTLKDRRSSIEDLRLTLLSVSDDVRVILIILCDRCVLLEQLPDLSMEDGKMVCRDVLQLLAPVAARLGIHVLKQRLEHHAFPFVYPSDAERIQEQLEDVRGGVAPFSMMPQRCSHER